MEISVRAWLHDRKEFFFPEGRTPSDLLAFFGILEGYRLKGVQFEIDLGSGVPDHNGIEIFNNDIMKVVEDSENEDIGIVAFDTGSFIVRNGVTGYEVDLAYCLNSDDEDYKFEVIGNVYVTEGADQLA